MKSDFPSQVKFPNKAATERQEQNPASAGETWVGGGSLPALVTGPGLELRQSCLALCLKSKGDACSRLHPGELKLRASLTGLTLQWSAWGAFLLRPSRVGPAFPGVFHCACMQAQSLQWCLTLCDPADCSTPGSSVHGILQARILEGAAIFSSRGFCWPSNQT